MSAVARAAIRSLIHGFIFLVGEYLRQVASIVAAVFILSMTSLETLKLGLGTALVRASAVDQDTDAYLGRSFVVRDGLSDQIQILFVKLSLFFAFRPTAFPPASTFALRIFALLLLLLALVDDEAFANLVRRM